MHVVENSHKNVEKFKYLGMTLTDQNDIHMKLRTH